MRESTNELENPAAADIAKNEAVSATEVNEQESTLAARTIPEQLFDGTKAEQVSFAEAIGSGAGAGDENLPGVLGLEASGTGRSKFQPNANADRKVRVFSFGPEGAILKLRRNGSKETEGITVTDIAFNEAFDKHVHLHELPNRTQITSQLTDGKRIYGYVKKPLEGRSKLYCPIHCWPDDITPPKPGFIQRVRVAKLIIG